MDNVKILHISDVHLGRKFQNLPSDKANIRRSETIISFESTLKAGRILLMTCLSSK